MNFKLLLGLLPVFLAACNGSEQNNSTQGTTENIVTVDTIVGSKIITDEIPGSAYRKRAMGYFVIRGKDTSDFTCIFTESKDGGSVGMDLNTRHLKPEVITYRQRLEELKIILPKAATEFNFDSLTTINFGVLIEHGDLAVELTNQYRQKFGTGNKLENYTTVGQFLKESRLGADVDNLFKPYSISVDRVWIEKLYFTTRKVLYSASKMETDSTNAPDKILNCMTWLRLVKK
jgi:hypothetical protein